MLLKVTASEQNAGFELDETFHLLPLSSRERWHREELLSTTQIRWVDCPPVG